jgi:hypothetical protein
VEFYQITGRHVQGGTALIPYLFWQTEYFLCYVVRRDGDVAYTLSVTTV